MAPDSGMSSTLGKIFVGGLQLEYTVVGKKSFPAVGEGVTVFGQVSHQTSGTIVATGLTLHDDIGRILYQQDQLTSGSATFGDSGATVAKKGTGSAVTIYGTIMGGGTQNQVYFSPMSGIEGDEGTLKVN